MRDILAGEHSNKLLEDAAHECGVFKLEFDVVLCVLDPRQTAACVRAIIREFRPALNLPEPSKKKSAKKRVPKKKEMTEEEIAEAIAKAHAVDALQAADHVRELEEPETI